jgi:hypothetical protein
MSTLNSSSRGIFGSINCLEGNSAVRCRPLRRRAWSSTRNAGVGKQKFVERRLPVMSCWECISAGVHASSSVVNSLGLAGLAAPGLPPTSPLQLRGEPLRSQVHRGHALPGTEPMYWNRPYGSRTAVSRPADRGGARCNRVHRAKARADDGLRTGHCCGSQSTDIGIRIQGAARNDPRGIHSCVQTECGSSSAGECGIGCDDSRSRSPEVGIQAAGPIQRAVS